MNKRQASRWIRQRQRDLAQMKARDGGIEIEEFVDHLKAREDRPTIDGANDILLEDLAHGIYNEAAKPPVEGPQLRLDGIPVAEYLKWADAAGVTRKVLWSDATVLHLQGDIRFKRKNVQAAQDELREKEHALDVAIDRCGGNLMMRLADLSDDDPPMDAAAGS